MARTELDLIERIRRRVPLPARSGAVLGIGDDCAIFRPPGASEDLPTARKMPGGRHWRAG